MTKILRSVRAETRLVNPPSRTAAWFNASAVARRRHGLRWWMELVLIGGVYGLYSLVRNEFGSAAVSPAAAADNADLVIDIEKALGLYIEADVQDAFIGGTAFIQFWNLFYGLFHFLVTFVVLIWLFFSDPGRYRFWRRAGLITTVSGLIGFAVFPLMPPRLLGDCGDYGACRPGSPYVDTVLDVGGIWSFESSGMEAISNQYAAMPSLHIGWALWCALILVARLTAPWARGLAGLYPLLTLFAIVVTANHYWLDGVGGVAAVGLGIWLSGLWDRRVPVGTFTSSARDRSGSTPQGYTVEPGDA